MPSGLTGVTAIGARNFHTVALKSDGTVAAWGNDFFGQIEPPAGLAGVKAIAAGGSHTVALLSDGSVVAWGYNGNGQTTVPVGLIGVQAISAGGLFTVALVDSTVSFGNQLIGTTSPAKTFTIKNSGEGSLNITNVSVIGGNASDFTVGTNGMLTTIPATSGTTTFTVTFNPSISGVRTTTLRVRNNDIDEGTFDIMLTGTGLAPEIAVFNGSSTNAVDERVDNTGTHTFANTDVGRRSTAQTFTIKNTGNGDLTGLLLAILGANPGDFVVESLGAGTLVPNATTTFAVTFSPKAGGTRNAVVAIASNDENESPFEIKVSGTGLTPEIAVFTGASIATATGERADNTGTNVFANTLVGGSSAVQAFTIKNAGPANLTGLALMKTGENSDDFILGTLGTNTLAPNATTTFTVTFSPTAGGSRRAVVAIASNDGDENPFEINVSGTGLAPEIAVFTGAGTSSVNERADNTGTNIFANANVGSSSVAQTFTIKNVGNRNLTGLALTKTGAASGDFTLRALGATSLAPNATTTFAVTFSPKAAGERSAVVAIASNDGDENPFEINVSGTGLASEIAVFTGASTNAVDERIDNTGTNVFANTTLGSGAPQIFTIKNTGNVNLTGLALTKTGTNPGDFIVGAPSVTTLAPGATITFTVTFSPTAGGIRNAVVAIASNDGNENPFEIMVKGTGLIPEIAVFTGASTNATAERIDNTGTNVFAGTTIGGTSAPQIFTIKNAGVGNLMGLAITTTGTNAAEFILGPLGATTLASNATTTFTVTFSPSAAGVRRAVVAIASNDGNENSFEIKVSGTGLVPEIAVFTGASTNAVDERTDNLGTNVFANTTAGASSAAQTFTIKNTGVGDLIGLTLSKSGPHPEDFTLSTLGTNILAQNATTTFTVTFSPTTGGIRNGVVAIASNDGNENPFEINLTGTGLAPEITVFTGANTNFVNERTDNSGTNVFVNANVGSSTAAQTFTIKNTGNLNLTGLSLTKTGTNPGDFNLSVLGATVLPPDATTTFTVTFSPIAGGARDATVAIASNDGNESPFEINVSGAGLAPQIAVEQPVGTSLRTGTIVAWGRNDFSQTNISSSAMGMRAIAAGQYHTVALKSDGTVVGWGNNDYGQTNAPAGLTDVQEIAAGGNNTVALKRDGTVVVWGINNSGQTNVPVGLTDIQAVAAGILHTVALKSDGTVVAWGNNSYGQRSVPVGLTGVQAIAAGLLHTVALKNDGTVVAWGNNGSGQTAVPAGLTSVKAIAAGGSHTVALKSDGTIVAWGHNDYGQTVAPIGLTDVTAIAAGLFFTVALKNDGTIVTWGDSDYGQTSVPLGLSGVQAIAAGMYHAVALVNSTVGFDNQIVATASPVKMFTIKNTGNAPLNIVGVSVTGGNVSDFSLDPTGMLTTVPIGSQTTFAVTFSPVALGTRRTTLRVLNNDTEEGIFDIVLTGTGVLPPSPNIQGVSLTAVGNGGFQFTFANPGNVTFSVLATTNLGLPLADWTVLGTATNIGGGLSQFGNPVSPEFPQRFYRLRFP